ncbi:MAG TPA: heme-binding protein [Allosphingosinicella sp.]|jgi:uncharacterized protein GlcG (DUF336 family)
MRAIFLLPLLCLAAPAWAQTPPGPAPAAPAPAPQLSYGEAVSLPDARRIADAAEAEARRRGFSMAFAIVDPSGSLILFHKMDGTQNGSVEVAIQKARTSALFRRPTKFFSDAVAGGRNTVLSLPNMIAIEGGVPIEIGGRVAGAIGVSGASSAEDGEVAAVGLAALRRR